MSIRADSLAAHGAEGRNGGDVRLGELQCDWLCPYCYTEACKILDEMERHPPRRNDA